jgi:hypothetical protein
MSEKPPIRVVRRGSFLQAYSPFDEEALRALPQGKPLTARLTGVARSGPQNRMYWALLRLVADNLDQDITPDTLHEWMKMRLGVTKEVKLASGRIETVTGSTAFDSLSHEQFTAYMQRVKDLIREQLIPRADSEAFIREAEAMIG